MTDAPKITVEVLLGNIASEHYFTAYEGVKAHRVAQDEPQDGESLKLLTFCVLVLKNGFTVTGESACVSPENFDAEVGREIAWKKAMEKLWPLLGYELKERLYQTKEANV